MAMLPPWSTKGVRRPALSPARAAAGGMPDGGVDLRARQPAAADAGDRPGAGGWRLPRLRRRYPLCQRGCRSPVSDRQVRRHANRPRPPAGGGEREGRGIWRSVGRRWRRPSSYCNRRFVRPINPCPIFSTPWQVEQSKSGKTTISGLSVMANMVETLRLGWSENLPPQPAGVGQDHPGQADHRPAAAVNGKLRSQ